MRVLLHLFIGLVAFVVSASTEAQSAADVVVRDQARISAHLASVEEYLRKRDVSHLTSTEREARAKNLDRLRDYWIAGVFPRNTLTDYPTPIFIDPAGRACAVGYLMIESGWETEAKNVAKRENLAYVNDIRSAEVGAWIAQSGLTVQEAAWIQPEYDFEFCEEDCPCDEEPVCASDGNTYLNGCIAEACAQQETYVAGCCSVESADEIRIDGAAYCRCCCSTTPPERCLDDDYVLGADLCTDFVEPPPLPSESSGCTAGPAPAGSLPTHLLLTTLALLMIRRRRR